MAEPRVVWKIEGKHGLDSGHWYSEAMATDYMRWLEKEIPEAGPYKLVKFIEAKA